MKMGNNGRWVGAVIVCHCARGTLGVLDLLSYPLIFFTFLFNLCT